MSARLPYVNMFLIDEDKDNLEETYEKYEHPTILSYKERIRKLQVFEDLLQTADLLFENPLQMMKKILRLLKDGSQQMLKERHRLLHFQLPMIPA